MDFGQARRILTNVQQQEEKFAKEVGKKADWGDPEDVAAYAALARAFSRKSILDQLVPDRRCPKCDTLTMSSRSWVLNKRRTEAICRSCFMRASYSGPIQEEGVVSARIVVAIDIRLRFDGSALNQSRKATGMTIRAFAEKCGWVESYQRQLEYGSIQSISPEQMSVVYTVLREASILPEDLTDPEEL